jgi:hypothetical protein
VRQYASISPRFWTSGSGKQLRGYPEAQVVALYLMSSPHTSMVGIFNLALPTLCHETGLSLEAARKGLQRCSEVDLAFYDEAEELMWIPALARHQIGERLSLGKSGKPDHRIAGVRRALGPFKGHRFYDLFVERYGSAYHLHSDVEEAPPVALPRAYVPDPDPARVPDPAPDPAGGAGGPPVSSPVAKPVPLERAVTAPEAAPRRTEPRNLADALKLSANERCALLVARPDLAQWVEPGKWPEVVSTIGLFREITAQPRLPVGQYHADSGLRAVVALYAADPPLSEAVVHASMRRVVGSEYWRRNGAKRGLQSLTLEVIRRELQPEQTSGTTAASSSFESRLNDKFGPTLPKRKTGSE